MTIVFVHGNPETDVIWDGLSDALRARGYDDQVRLSPPGFGSPVPPGFDATVTGYRDWLIEHLVRIGRPVDLVGHDWGGGHTLNVAIARPDLLRSWCSDAVGVFDVDYRWHVLARVSLWEGPRRGLVTAAMTRTPAPVMRALLRPGLRALGMDPDTARRVATGYDRQMGTSMLRLYRSADRATMLRLGADLERAAARPGLAIIATGDHLVGTEAQRRRTAERAGARVEVLEGLPHCWMVRDPERGAAALDRFWSGLA
jgi:pimeloyl-ACP methyl ester carboxylesterase